MFTIRMKKRRKQIYYIHYKNIKMNNGNQKHPKKDKSKVTYYMTCYGINLYQSFRKQ